MTVRYVESSTYPTISAAMADSISGDTIRLVPGYSNETASVTVDDMLINGGGNSVNIDLMLAQGVSQITLQGYARMNVEDNSGGNVITGNSGANQITVTNGGDVVHGGLGIDRLVIDYHSAVATVTGTVTSFTDGGTHSVTFDGVENITAFTGAGNDTITTADGNNKIFSAGGNDTITLGDGQNYVLSGAGNDTVTAGDGGNKVNGGRGDNTITTGAGQDSVYTGSGNDTVITGAQSDLTLVSGGIDSVDSGTGNDQLNVHYSGAISSVVSSLSGDLAGGYTGSFADGNGNVVNFSNTENFFVNAGSGNDQITTGDGRDNLSGLGGGDFLDAAGGTDTIHGGHGADTITGGGGADLLNGGTGADIFVFSSVSDSQTGSMDLITGLRNADIIDVSQIDADSGMVGNQAFVMVSQFDGHAGQATFSYDAGTSRTYLSLDVDGDSVADFRLATQGNHASFHDLVL